ncbi:MAG: hypothetical protein IPN63_06145 [Gammaproteobacteria bacterium]|nr:hypothetical protein [Gammaproteobacteria bacterium]
MREQTPKFPDATMREQTPKFPALTSEELFVGVTQSRRIELPVSVFADELPNPVGSLLSIDFAVSEQELTYEKLTS